ncbi:MAG: class I SAM-dependent methyltransferase [Burkholderiaceae bacterium]
MDLSDYRASEAERDRTADLLRLLPRSAENALDIGARDGHFSVLMADRIAQVTALDLTLPDIADPRVHCVAGNAAALPFSDRQFDVVFCAEVLEHIPEPTLQMACKEISRVSAKHVLIGVPNEQDIRVGRCTCQSCGKSSPPWGHVNSFDSQRLRNLFPEFEVESESYVGERREATNGLSTLLMDLGGNPYGTYGQEEPCIHCGQPLKAPVARSVVQRASTKLAFVVRRATERFAKPRGNWVHILFRRRADT